MGVKRMTTSQKWISKHLGKLIGKYAGLYVAVVENKVVAFGKSSKIVEEEVQKKYKIKVPSVILVPTKEDLAHVLCGI